MLTGLVDEIIAGKRIAFMNHIHHCWVSVNRGRRSKNIEEIAEKSRMKLSGSPLAAID
jgi:hypothetical protein